MLVLTLNSIAAVACDVMTDLATSRRETFMGERIHYGSTRSGLAVRKSRSLRRS